MQGQPNTPEGRVEELEATVEHLTSEVTSLKLELATLVSALREKSFQAPLLTAAPVRPVGPPSHPSITPAAIVVLLATGLLTWQLIAVPPSVASAPPRQPFAPAAYAPSVIEVPPTEPPVTPLVEPTIYKGTLTVAADRPDAKVFVNRHDVGIAPVRVRNLRAGAHLVWIESAGYRRWTRVVTVPAERVTRVSADLEPIVEP